MKIIHGSAQITLHQIDKEPKITITIKNAQGANIAHLEISQVDYLRSLFSHSYVPCEFTLADHLQEYTSDHLQEHTANYLSKHHYEKDFKPLADKLIKLGEIN